MSRYLWITGGVLLIFGFLFLFLSYVSPFGSSQLFKSVKNSDVILYFQPDSVTSSCLNSSYSIPIYLSSVTSFVNSAQIELSYDPTLLYDVYLTPAQDNFFGDPKNYAVTLEEVREQFGRASLAIQLHPDQPQKNGNKPVALFKFTINSVSASASSKISFLSKSTVGSTANNNSILTGIAPFMVYCDPAFRNMSTPSSQLNATP